MKRGIIYYNTNTKCLHRLLVSIYSLRKVSNEPVVILSSGEVSHPYCYKIAGCFDNVEVIETDFSVDDGKNRAYLEKCMCHIFSPFDTTVFLDADTVVIKPFLDELCEKAEEHEFVVTPFANWESGRGQIKKRINQWKKIYPDLIEDALNFGPAINTGVFAFTSDSEAMNEWFEISEPGRFDCFIPDETGMQVWIPHLPHILVGQEFNRSCKYDDPYKENTKIIHFHGSKHCRMDAERKEFLFNGEIWYNLYKEVKEQNLGGIIDWKDLGDRYLAIIL